MILTIQLDDVAIKYMMIKLKKKFEENMKFISIFLLSMNLVNLFF